MKTAFLLADVLTIGATLAVGMLAAGLLSYGAYELLTGSAERALWAGGAGIAAAILAAVTPRTLYFVTEMLIGSLIPIAERVEKKVTSPARLALKTVLPLDTASIAGTRTERALFGSLRDHLGRELKSGRGSLVMALARFDHQQHAIPTLEELNEVLMHFDVRPVRATDDIMLEPASQAPAAGLTEADLSFLYDAYRKQLQNARRRSG